MAPGQGGGWHPGKRLRQLESLSGRGLLLGCGGKGSAAAAPAAHYVTLSARGSADEADSWHVMYRSETVGGTSNPEWQPLVWDEQQQVQQDALLDSSEVQVLLALHAVEQQPQASAAGLAAAAEVAAADVEAAHAEAAEAAEEGAEVAAGAAGRSIAGAAAVDELHGLGWPLLFGTANRPAFMLPDPMGQAVEAATAAAAAAEGVGGGGGGGRRAVGASSSTADEQQRQQQQRQQQQEDVQLEEHGSAPDATASTAAGAEPLVNEQLRHAEEQQQRRQQGEQHDQQQERGEQHKVQRQDLKQQLAAKGAAPVAGNGLTNGCAAVSKAAPLAEDAQPGGSSSSTAAGTALAWPQAAAAALASTGCCPGRLVAAWKLSSLDQLFPAGHDLAAVRSSLLPNTLVLQFADGGCYLCPPPQQDRAAAGTASQLASPRKTLSGIQPAGGATAAADERPDAAPAGGPPGATRRFANLLVSKLLRSTPNLQEAGSPSGSLTFAADLALEHSAMSDAESDAGSDTTTASRLTAATAASELPAAAAAAGRAAAGAAAGGGGSSSSSRLISLVSAHQCITSIAALHGRLRDLAGRSQALQEQLEQRLLPHQQRQRQQHALAALAHEAAACRQQAGEAQQQLAEAQAAAAAARKLATVRAQAMVTTLKVMQAADRRVGEAEESLHGEEGRGRLVAALRELVARRCQMVGQLGAIVQLGPTPVSIPEAPPGGYLEDRLELQWAGAVSGGGSGSGSEQASFSSAGGQPVQGGGGRSYGGYAGSGIMDSPSKYRQEMRLSIGGLEIRPAVWRKAFDDGGYDSDAAEDREAGVALGYVAQVVDRLAAYLDVPLRYPLALRGSRSGVVDNYPPAGTWAEGEEGAKRPLFGRADAAAAADRAALRPVEYPMYCDSNRERPRFAVGVFLLNKDVIQLLQAHGISASGPNQILQNLYKLLLAAQSALPHLPPALVHAGMASAARSGSGGGGIGRQRKR